MSASILATRCSGRRPTAGALRDSIAPNGSSFAKLPAARRPLLSNSGESIRHASVLRRSAGEMRGSGDAPNHQKILIQKMLRFCQRRSSSPQLARISSGFLSRNSLTAKGDALIHGLSLVARPVGSEWRNHRPHLASSQTN
jgi:hypothetical protein